MSNFSNIEPLRPSPRRARRWALGLSLVAACLGLGVTAAADTPDGPAVAPLDDSAKPFKITVANATASVGEEAKILVTIEAASGYKCNKSYPHKARKLEADEGAELTAKMVKGSLEGKKIVIPVGVKAKKAGTFGVRGQVKFSVCNDSQCVIKKVPLDAKLTAS